MVTKPTKLPEWAVNPTDPNQIVEPPQTKKDEGWLVNEKPPAEWQNWWQNNVYDWTVYLNQQIDVLLRVRATDPASLSVNILAGQAVVNRTLVAIPATTHDFTSDVSALSPGESQLAAVFVDDAGSVSVILGAPSIGAPDLPDESAGAFLVGQALLAVVRLTGGMTEILQSDISSPLAFRDQNTDSFADNLTPAISSPRRVYGDTLIPLMLRSGATHVGLAAADPEGLGRSFLMLHSDYRSLPLPAPGSGQHWWRIAKLIGNSGRGGGRLRIGSTGGSTIPGDYVFEISSDWNNDCAITQLTGPLGSGSIVSARVTKPLSGGSTGELYVDILVDHETGVDKAFDAIAFQDKLGGGDLVLIDPIADVAAEAVVAQIDNVDQATLASAGASGSTVGALRFFPLLNGGEFRITGELGVGGDQFWTLADGLGGGRYYDLMTAAERPVTTTITSVSVTPSTVLNINGDYIVCAIADLRSVSTGNIAYNAFIDVFSGGGSITGNVTTSVLRGNNFAVPIITIATLSGAAATTRLEYNHNAGANGKYEVHSVTWSFWRKK